MRPRAVGGIRRFGTLAIGMMLGAGGMFVGLAQADRIVPARPDVLVALGQRVEVEHRVVDLKVGKGDFAGAIESLESLRSGPWPSREDATTVSVALRHDAYGRLVRLRLDHPDVDPLGDEKLLEMLAEGLGDEDSEASPFTARLWALRGELYESQGRDDEALGAYEKALEINALLLERELGGGQ